MKRRIFIGFTLLVAAFVLVAVLVTGNLVRTVARKQLLDQVVQEAEQISQELVGKDPRQALAGLISSSRVTLVASDGAVLFDNWADGELDNHADRPELAAAAREGSGSAIRYSDTTNSTAVYYAQRLEDGTLLRVAAPERLARGLAQGVAPFLVIAFLLLMALLLLFANIILDRLIKPIVSIDLDHPEDAVVYDELLPLVKRIDQQNKHTMAQMDALEARRMELNTLVNGMHEGFVAMSLKDEIILINPSACSMLGVTEDQALGKGLPAINRSPVILKVLEELRSLGTADGLLEKDGRVYMLLANRIQGRSGAILLLSDQTDKLQAEDMRKRFTANVSHELRTPLTTICGYAELLDKGMVKSEDAGQFYGVILRESKRMLTLVEDILRLSKLDEGHLAGQKAAVNLHEVAKAVSQSLELMADERKVHLSYEGTDAWVLGDATLLDELCSNLIDNAIKYNVENGSVKVRVTNCAQAILTVTDTGIGIEKEHQPRVFERFYRTDKSRSKATGGTGLGLSIVKHAAEFHKAKITLQSQVGQGTSITVVFPALRAQS